MLRMCQATMAAVNLAPAQECTHTAGLWGATGQACCELSSAVRSPKLLCFSHLQGNVPAAQKEAKPHELYKLLNY